MRFQRSSIVFSLILAGFAATVAAQNVTTPGQVGDTLKPPPKLEAPRKAPKVDRVEKPAPAQPAPQAGDASVVVKSFEFSGNTLLTPAELEAAVKDYVGRPLSLYDIYEAADKVAAIYIERGYTLATVNVPAQKVDNGVVKLEVIEGRVSAIKVQGNKRYREGSIIDFLTGITPAEVYRGTDLEESLARLNELPGLSTRAILRPGSEFGTSDVVIEATEDPFQGLLILDNYGRESTGEFRATLSGTFNNPFKFADQLQFLGLVSKDGLLKYGYVDYNAPIGSGGNRVSISYGYADFEVDEDVFDGIDGKNKTARIAFTTPLIRERSVRMGLTIGVSNTQADSDLLGVPLPRDTDLTLLELGGTWLRAWNNLSTSQVKLDLSSNFGTATTEKLNEPDKKDDQALKAELNLLHLQALPQKFQLLIGASAQWTPDPLADTEQFSLGGPGNVRGYPPSDVRGDRGVFGSLTLRRPFIIGPATIYAGIFADSGRVYRVDVASDTSKQDGLSSVGTGGEIRYRQFSFKLDLSFPTDNHPPSDGQEDYRFFGALSADF